MKRLIAALFVTLVATQATAQTMTADEVRAEARAALGAAIPEVENYPDSMVAGAWAWMGDVEDGKGAIDAKTMQLIGLAVASQVPCQYCTYYHRAAARSLGATDQEVAEAAAIAGYVRNWSAVLYGTGTDLDAYRAQVDAMFGTQ